MALLLSLNNSTRKKIETRKIRKILIRDFSKLKIKKNSLEVSLALVTDRIIRQLNKKYLHRNSVTDVLAFSGTDEFIKPPAQPRFLGEIIISLPQAKRQAKEFSHSLEREIEILFVHGLLHLFGYDHERIKEKRLMERMAKKILG